MKMEWSFPFAEGKSWEPNYEGLFFDDISSLVFFYRNNRKLNATKVLARGINTISIEDGSDVDMPGLWVLLTQPSNILLCSEKYCFSIDTMSRCIPTKEQVSEYRSIKAKRLGQDLYPMVFQHLDYTIKYAGGFEHKCYYQDKEIWKYKAQGYLYTDIEFYQEYALFGTAGQGGGFYAIEYYTGKPFMEIKTGGTTQIVGNGDIRYILILGRKGCLAKVSLKTGSVLDTIELQGSTTQHSRLHLKNNKLYVTTFEYETVRAYRDCNPSRVIMNCVTI